MVPAGGRATRRAIRNEAMRGIVRKSPVSNVDIPSDASSPTFTGMPLKLLSIFKAGITDLRPPHGMELEEIRLTPKNITQGLDMLRDMKSRKVIGIGDIQAWPAAEFWERYDKGEFTK